MIYTAHLDLSPEQRNRPSTAETMRHTAAVTRRFIGRIVAGIREGVQKARAALAANNGFRAQ